MKNFSEHMRDNEKKEAIVSYDCSGYHDPFRDKLRKFLEKEYAIKEITQSNLEIYHKLTLEEIERLKNEIRRLFNTAVPLTEGKRDKKTIVTIITPNGTKFELDGIINEEV